jgi:transposase
MSWCDLLPEFANLAIEAITYADGTVTIELISTRQHAVCTTCQTLSAAGHGWFTRWVQGLPMVGRSMRLRIRARRFRCLHTECPRRTLYLNTQTEN